MLNIKKYKLTSKFLPPILAGTIIALLAGAGMLISSVKNTTEQQMELARAALVAEQQSAKKSQLMQLNSKADSLGSFMSKTAPDLIISYDFTTLKDYQNIAERDVDVAYAAYLKPDGSPLTDYKAPADKGKILERKYKITSEDEELGYVLLGMSLDHVNQSLEESNHRIEQAVSAVEKQAESALYKFITIMSIDVVVILLVITGIVYFLFRALVLNRIRETNTLLSQLSDGNGDLTRRLPVENDDEVSQLCMSVNDFISQLQSMISSIVADVQTLTNESQQLTQYASELSVNADTQRMETTQVATAMNQMTATVQEVANSANNAAQAARNADEETSEGKTIVTETIDSIESLANNIHSASDVINELEANSENIGGVLDVIRGIAEQTNLLALNAAIEAARAGEQGRGFAVVADEVRTLASRTQASTEEIQQMIEKLQSGSRHAVTVMQQSSEKTQQTVNLAANAGSSLENITQAVGTINEMNTHIATAAEEQSSVAEEINKNVDTINSISDSTAQGAQMMAKSSNSLSELANHLQELTRRFKI